MSDDTTIYPIERRPTDYTHRIYCELSEHESRLLYAVLWQALTFADSKMYLLSLLDSARRDSPELALQAEEVSDLANTLANVLRKFGFQPPRWSDGSDETRTLQSLMKEIPE
jgi:hypothetical protein